MTSKRVAFTLVELMIVSAITAVIVGAMGGLFVFVSTRAAQAIATNGVLMQTQSLSNELEATIAKAQSCRTVNLNGTLALGCIMPSVGTDTDADGKADKFMLQSVGPTGREGFGGSQRVWFYMSDSTGNPAVAPAAGEGVLWRAYRNDGSSPTTADRDTKFAYYYSGGSSRWNLIDGVTFAMNPNGSVRFTIASSKLRRAERRLGASDSASTGVAFTLSRLVVCRNWRK